MTFWLPANEGMVGKLSLLAKLSCNFLWLTHTHVLARILPWLLLPFSRSFFFPRKPLAKFSFEASNFSICLWWQIGMGEIQLHICLQFQWWAHLVSANFIPVLPQITQLFIYLLGICRTLVKRDKKREGFSKLGLSSSAESLFNRFIKQLEGNWKEMNETTYLQFFLATKFGN